jgi:plasmid stabilization system protein ParE
VAEPLPIRWTGPALEDLRAIREWIEKDRPDAAKRLAAKIRGRLEVLASFPASGRAVPEIGIDNYREIVVSSFRIIYAARESEIVILRVWHSRREIPEAHD